MTIPARCRKTLLSIALFLAGGMAWARSGIPIAVRVPDLAQVPAGDLRHAQEVAGRLLGRAGVEVHWIRCEPVASDPSPACAGPLAPATLLLRIRTARESRLDSDALGVAVASPEGGVSAGIFHDRVRAAAGRARVASRDVLGPALAHEIGHLLGLFTHSRSGLMIARWGSTELEQAARGALRFARHEEVSLRRQARRRLSRSAA